MICDLQSNLESVSVLSMNYTQHNTTPSFFNSKHHNFSKHKKVVFGHFISCIILNLQQLKMLNSSVEHHHQSVRPTVQSWPLVKQTAASAKVQLHGWENWGGVERGEEALFVSPHKHSPCLYWSRRALFTDPGNPGTLLNAD